MPLVLPEFLILEVPFKIHGSQSTGRRGFIRFKSALTYAQLLDVVIVVFEA